MTTDVIVVGGGHNRLTCAAYLAKAGLKVTVLERRGVVGGAAVTEEFHPGFKNSVASYTVSLLNPRVIADLELHRHGLKVVERKMSNFLPLDGDHFCVGDGITQAETARFSKKDAERLPAYWDRLDRIADVLRDLVLATPPNLVEGSFAEALPELLKSAVLGRKLSKLDLTAKRDLLALFSQSAGDWLDGWFESAPIKAAYGFDGVVGNYASPYTPGSAYVLLHHVFGEVNGKKGAWGHAIGGMGAITQAMAASGRSHGVEHRTSAAVERILLDGGRAVGVRLESGEELRARFVLANTDPKRTFLKFIGREHLPAGFADGIERLRMGHATVRMNLALSGPPSFAALSGEEAGLALGGSITIFPTREQIETNYRTALAGGIIDEPYLDIRVPSAIDDTLAPPGHHVMSLIGKYYPYRLADGQSWDDIGSSVADRILATLVKYLPNLGRLIVARQFLTPLDLERVFGLTEGDIFHGRHDLDQIFGLRPHPQSAQFATPIPGLYLCGSGAHPGGAVSGAPGRNAAMRVIKDAKRAR
jgi:phytoene dehydrogenase-like protein